MCLGRLSVFIINFILTTGTSLIVVMFTLLFSRISVSLAQSIPREFFLHQVLSLKATYCLLLYVLLFPNILKKEIKELRMNTYLLFGGVISLVLSFLARVLHDYFYSNLTV